MNRVSVTTLLLLAIGCGGAQQPPEAESSAAPAKAAAPKSTWQPAPFPEDGAIKLVGLNGPADKPWNDMSYDEKEWYMVGKVHPVMRQVFQTFNAKKYEGEKFECTPCHGEKPEERKYKMPSDHLSPVPAYKSPEWNKMKDSRVFKFMTKRVTPAMGKLLGDKVWNWKTGEGYSCWGCHPKAE